MTWCLKYINSQDLISFKLQCFRFQCVFVNLIPFVYFNYLVGFLIFVYDFWFCKETYGNVSSDSSDDEDWTDDYGPRKRSKKTGEGSPISPNGNAPIPRSGKQKRGIKRNLKETVQCPDRKTRQNLNSENTNKLPAKSHEGSSTPSSSGKAERSSYRRLGENVTQVIGFLYVFTPLIWYWDILLVFSSLTWIMVAYNIQFCWDASNCLVAICMEVLKL